MKRPCYQCEDRQPGCHAHCGRYAESKRELDEIKAKREREEKTRNEVSGVLYSKLKRKGMHLGSKNTKKKVNFYD